MSGKINHYLSRAALALAMTAFAYQMGVTLSTYLKYAIVAIGFPFPLDYGEGPLLDQTLRMANFENIYRDVFSSPPYTISNYTPLFMLMQVPFAWIFGPALWYGRLISILCVFAAALFISLTIFTFTRNWIGALTGGLLLVAFPYIRQWSMFNRVDELALALSWAALFVTVRYVGRTDDRPLPKWGFWLAASLFVASIYTRQTYALAAPFAAFLWLIFGTHGSCKSRIQLAAKLGLVVGGITIALFLVINAFTSGGFYQNIVVANINVFYWQTVYLHVKEVGESFYPLLILAGLFLLIERWIVKERTQIWPLVIFYLLAAGASAITIGKTGSSINYMFEFCAALSLAAGSALAWIGRLKWHGRTWLQIVILAALSFQLSIMVDWKGVDFYDFENYLTSRTAHRENAARLQQIVKDAPGIVLADEYMGLIPLAGKRLYFEPFGFKQMSDAGMLDETSFVREIRDRKFDAILWYQPMSWPAVAERWTPAQRAMVLSSYRLDSIIGDVYVYRPRKN